MSKQDAKKDDQVKNRYTDEELEEFKQIILDKLEKARRDLKMLTEAFTNSDEHGTDDTSPTFKVLEEGYQVLSKEENSRLAARQSKFIQNLENALVRIENKTYGICSKRYSEIRGSSERKKCRYCHGYLPHGGRPGVFYQR